MTRRRAPAGRRTGRFVNLVTGVIATQTQCINHYQLASFIASSAPLSLSLDNSTSPLVHSPSIPIAVTVYRRTVTMVTAFTIRFRYASPHVGLWNQLSVHFISALIASIPHFHLLSNLSIHHLHYHHSHLHFTLSFFHFRLKNLHHPRLLPSSNHRLLPPTGLIARKF